MVTRLSLFSWLVSLEDLDAALGWGAALTKLIGERNPYRGVTFRTKKNPLQLPLC